MPYRRSYGLSRRFAPRNDIHKLAACLHNLGALPGCCRKASLQPQKRTRLLPAAAPLLPRSTPARPPHVIASHVLATANTYPSSACHCVPRSCNREHVLPSACHCEPVRTLVWQSVLPAGKPGNLAILWANSHPRSPVVIANQCAHWCGNPFSPQRNQKVSST